MSLNSILQEHTRLCELTYQIILEENSTLKSSGLPPDEEYLERKKRILAELENSLAILREQGARQKGEIPKCRAAIEKAQQVILKTLLLDRENEQLLLKNTMAARAVPGPFKPSASRLQKVYQQQDFEGALDALDA